MNFPRSSKERVALRMSRTKKIMDAAAFDAANYGKSIPCSMRLHADDPNGCTSDGRGCLCGCHDPEEKG